MYCMYVYISVCMCMYRLYVYVYVCMCMYVTVSECFTFHMHTHTYINTHTYQILKTCRFMYMRSMYMRYRNANSHTGRQACFIKQLIAEQRRHVSCVGDGGNWTHAVQVRIWLDTAFAFNHSARLRGRLTYRHILIGMFTDDDSVKINNYVLHNGKKHFRNELPLQFISI